MHIIISPSVHNLAVTKNNSSVEYLRWAQTALKSRLYQRASESRFFIDVEETHTLGVNLYMEGQELCTSTCIRLFFRPVDTLLVDAVNLSFQFSGNVI